MAVPTLVVSEAQKAHFRSFGYAVFRQVFSAAEMARYTDALEVALRRVRGGADFDGKQRQEVMPIIEEDPETFYPLLDDERLMGIVDGLLGEDSLYTGGNDGNIYVGETRWHTDGGGIHAYSTLKTAFYCDPVSEGRGCLSVLPGSHHPEYSRTIYQLVDAGIFDLNSPDVAGRQPLESTPGDVVAFDHRLWHASFGGGDHRRMFTFNWASYPRMRWEETWLYGYLMRVNQRYGKRTFTDRLWQTAGPRRRQKMAKLVEMGL